VVSCAEVSFFFPKSPKNAIFPLSVTWWPIAYQSAGNRILEESMQIGRYQVQGEIGRGATSIVYRAFDPAIGRPVAIKVLQNATRGPNMEALSLGRLSHPNIVGIFDFLQSGDRMAIVMELVDGYSLEAMINSGNLREKSVAVDIVRQAALALDFAHTNGIFHRDVKPGNILVHQGRTAKLADFGTARMTSGEFTAALEGTPSYMPPEQCRGQAVTAAGDQYALAVIAFELLTGQKPFIGSDVADLIKKILEQRVGSARALNPTLPVAVDEVLDRALAKEPNARFDTCVEFTDRLGLALAQRVWALPKAPGQTTDELTQEISPVSAGVAEKVKPGSRKFAAAAAGSLTEAATKRGFWADRRNQWIVACGLALASIIIALWFFTRPDPNLQDSTAAVAPTNRPTAMPEAEGSKVETVSENKEPEKPKEAGSETPVDDVTVETVTGGLDNAEQKNAIQRILFTTNPSNATVTADGDANLSCTTPCSLDLNGGNRRVVLEKEGFEPAVRNLKVPGDSEIFTALELRGGVLLLRSSPEGSSVTINGKPSGVTPLRLKLPAGKYELEITKPGFSRDVGSVDLREGATITVEAKLSQQ
jgi:predicted Ser/Thr protein kinase